MKYRFALKVLIPLMGLLALFAAGMGLFYPLPGEPYPFTSHRGESVMINGRGLYYYDTVSSAAQQQANDVVTLFVALPLLAVTTRMAFRGSLRGHLLLTGTLGFFLYTYLSMCMLTAFNALFLVYVAIFGLSLYAFILCMMSFDLDNLPRHFSDRLPRGWIAGLLFTIGAFLALAWLGRALMPILQNTTPLLDNGITMVIQAMDLSLIIPLVVLAGILLLRRRPWGYLLASVGLAKSLTLGIAVSLMSLNMARVGVAISPVELVVFPGIALAGAVMTGILLKHVSA